MGWKDAPLADGWQGAPVVDEPVAEPVTDFSGNLRIGPIDTGIPLPQAVNKGLAQFGSGMADWILGAQQIAHGATAQDATEKRKLDAKLNDSFTGKALNVAGQIAPSLAIPFGYAGAAGRAAPIVEGMVAGAAQGAFQPVAEGESRAANTAIGTVAGGAVPGVIQGARALATPRNGDLAARAINQYGIPLGVADVTDSKIVKAARSVLNDLPVTGAMGAADKEAVQRGFNRAVGDTFGANADSLTPAVVDAARGRMGAEFDRIWGSNTMPYDAPLFQEIQRLRQSAAMLPGTVNAHHGGGDAARLWGWLNDVESKMVPDAQGNLYMPGDVANRMQSGLRKQAESASGFLKDDLNTLRQAMISAFNRNVSPADAAALSANRNAYKAFKTVEPILNKAEAGVAGRVAGDVPAALLPGAVVQSYGNRVAQSPFADLSQIAGRYLVDRTPQTGGSARALIQNTGVGALTLGGGLGAGMATGTALPVAAGFGAGIGLQSALGSTRLANSLLTPQVQRGLLSAPQLAPAVSELLRTNAQRAAIPLSLGLLVPSPALE